MIIVIICLIKVEFYVFYIKINFNIKIRLVGINVYEEKLRKIWVFLYLLVCLSIGYLIKFFFFKDIKRIKFNWFIF